MICSSPATANSARASTSSSVETVSGSSIRDVLSRPEEVEVGYAVHWTRASRLCRIGCRRGQDALFKPVSYELSQLLGDIDLGKLALPELQRPFVWKKSAVRDLLDSMYRGFPVGYLMLWNAAEVDAKLIGVDGKQHTPTEFIVDGQQRLTGLYAVMKGAEVTFKDFSKGRISIAFRPRDGQFDVTDAAIEKDPEFLPNITQLWMGEDWEVIETFVERLRASKPEALEGGQEKQLRTALSRLSGLEDFPFLAVQIGHEVEEERVAEIFLRVNSGGTMLTQADFILTLLSVFREEDRRRLEHFAQAVRIVPGDATPSPYNHLVKPAADQLLRVAVLVAFQRGRLQSVLALLRGGSLDGDATLVEGDRETQLDKLTAAIDVILDLTSWHEYIKTHRGRLACALRRDGPLVRTSRPARSGPTSRLRLRSGCSPRVRARGSGARRRRARRAPTRHLTRPRPSFSLQAARDATWPRPALGRAGAARDRQPLDRSASRRLNGVRAQESRRPGARRISVAGFRDARR